MTYFPSMEKVTFLKLNFDSELNAKIDAAMSRVNASGYYILGPEVARFEKKFAAFCGTEYALGISNGLDALFIALKAMNIGPQDEVIVPGNTFIATWLAVSQVGAKVIPVDADIETGQMSAELLKKALDQNKKVKCVILVHLYGVMGDVKSIQQLCQERGVFLLEDAAQAHGTTLKGKKAGAWGDVAAFSFYPGKNLGALGDAGAVVSNNKELMEKMALLRSYGSKKKYYHDVEGYNHRLDELQAAILSEKMEYLDRWNDVRAKQVAFYQSKFKSMPGLKYFSSHAEFTAWHLFVILVKDREALQAFLAEQGIETLIHYPIACHDSGAYKHLGYTSQDLPVSAQIARECLSLPMGPHLKEEQLQKVVNAVLSYFKA